MVSLMDFLLTLTAGMVIGLVYFWGLRCTIDRLLLSPKPARLMLTSYALRAGGLITVFYLIMGGRGERIVFLLIGFLLARQTLIRRWGGSTTLPR
jgi:F1F0 ATPase subunit 2